MRSAFTIASLSASGGSESSAVGVVGAGVELVDDVDGSPDEEDDDDDDDDDDDESLLDDPLDDDEEELSGMQLPLISCVPFGHSPACLGAVASHAASAANAPRRHAFE
jgi:hypothetical protein